MKTNTVTSLVEGERPNTNSSNNEITFYREFHELWRMDLNKHNPYLILDDIGAFVHAISPSGKKYLVLLPHKNSLTYSSYYFLTVVDPNTPDNKFILEPNFHISDFRWVEK